MNSPPTIVDREKRLLQQNADLDKRFKNLMRSPRETRHPRQIKRAVVHKLPNVAASREASSTPAHAKPAVNPMEVFDKYNDKYRATSICPDVSHAVNSFGVLETYRNENFADSDTDVVLSPKPNLNADRRVDSSISGSSTPDAIVTNVNDTHARSTAISPSTTKLRTVLSRTVNADTDPHVRRTTSTEATVKFLKAKVSILEHELEKCRADEKTKAELIAAQQNERGKLQCSVDRLQAQSKVLNEQVHRLEESLESARALVKAKDLELDEARRTVDDRNQEIIKLTHSQTSLERRLGKSSEDLEYTRQNYQAVRAAEQEISRLHKADQKHADAQLKLLTEQRTGLIAAYKKQLFLLDNLRRQNACLEQSKLVDFVERDFVRMLENTK